MADSPKGKVYRVIDRIKHDGAVIEAGKLIRAGEHMAVEAVEELLRLPHPPIKEHKAPEMAPAPEKPADK